MNRSVSASRRDFLKAASLTSAVFGAPATQLFANETRASSDNKGLPKNIIFMVSDGMNHGAISLAHHFQAYFHGKQTNWTTLYRERPVVRCLAETFSANSLVTDSAAAASAWGGGHRINNGSLNVAPDGTHWAPLQTKFKQANVLTGLVSTATITHATPAGFAANTSNRGKEDDIAQQYFDRGVPVLLGGGTKFFPEPLREKFKGQGYDLLGSRDELLAAKGSEAKPVLGTFSSGYIPLDIDRKNDEELTKKIPTLAEMARFATERLDALSQGRQWFLMVEGARIDHCGHANDAAGSIHEQLAFDEAIGAMIDYASRRGDTMVVITTDHGCGGLQLNGMSAQQNQAMAPGIYNGTTPGFQRIAGFKHSFEWMRERAKGLSGPPLRDYITENTGTHPSNEELKEMQGMKGDLARIFGRRHGVAWTSGNHTGDLVEFCAFGPGSHLFPAYVKNFEVHNLLLKAMALA